MTEQAPPPLTARSIIERLTTEAITVDVNGYPLPIRPPGAAAFQGLIKLFEAAQNTDSPMVDSYKINVAVVRACVPDIASDDEAVALLLASGGMLKSPLLEKCFDVVGLDKAKEHVAHIEETELGNL